ncbi:hypothetical protein Lal_00042934 [Lupinus albus]|nr:hypothetical protein Lal_00042934 [Lupinus albus]
MEIGEDGGRCGSFAEQRSLRNLRTMIMLYDDDDVVNCFMVIRNEIRCAYDVDVFGSSYVAHFGSSYVASFGSSNVAHFGSSYVESFGSSNVAHFGSSYVSSFGSSNVASFGSSNVASFGLRNVASFGSSYVANFGSISVLGVSLERANRRLGERGSPGRVKSWAILKDSRLSENCLA